MNTNQVVFVADTASRGRTPLEAARKHKEIVNYLREVMKKANEEAKEARKEEEQKMKALAPFGFNRHGNVRLQPHHNSLLFKTKYSEYLFTWRQKLKILFGPSKSISNNYGTF